MKFWSYSRCSQRRKTQKFNTLQWSSCKTVRLYYFIKYRTIILTESGGEWNSVILQICWQVKWGKVPSIFNTQSNDTLVLFLSHKFNSHLTIADGKTSNCMTLVVSFTKSWKLPKSGSIQLCDIRTEFHRNLKGTKTGRHPVVLYLHRITQNESVFVHSTDVSNWLLGWTQFVC